MIVGDCSQGWQNVIMFRYAGIQPCQALLPASGVMCVIQSACSFVLADSVDSRLVQSFDSTSRRQTSETAVHHCFDGVSFHGRFFLCGQLQ